MLSSAKELADYGFTIEQAQTKLRDLFTEVSLTTNVVFSGDAVKVLATGEVIKNFSGIVVAKFEREGIPVLILSTGDVVEITIEVV